VAEEGEEEAAQQGSLAVVVSAVAEFVIAQQWLRREE